LGKIYCCFKWKVFNYHSQLCSSFTITSYTPHLRNFQLLDFNQNYQTIHHILLRNFVTKRSNFLHYQNTSDQYSLVIYHYLVIISSILARKIHLDFSNLDFPWNPDIYLKHLGQICSFYYLITSIFKRSLEHLGLIEFLQYLNLRTPPTPLHVLVINLINSSTCSENELVKSILVILDLIQRIQEAS
jgi:hypothetical protein